MPALHLYFDERDNRTEETVLNDFPVRDKKLVLHIRRRRWLKPDGTSCVLDVYPKLVAQGTRLVRKCRTVHRYDCMVFADSSAFLRYSTNFPTIIVAISIIMLTFAKEGGGGTPPVPLEPSKKLHFAAFCFLLGFLPFYFLILHDAYNALNYINILLRVAVFLESNPALFYSFLREKFFFVKIENYTLGSLFSCLM